MGLDDSFFRMTVSQLAAGLKKKAFSAQELCRASIARIEALDPQINAVVVRDFERARNEARLADEALSRGDQKLLTGIPMTVKESFDLRGHPTTWGFPVHSEHVAREDSLTVQRLKGAGALVLGKTNVPPALGDWQSANPIYGRTNNPHDVTRSPGGSSGGSAAAIAMGFSALEMGSDIGGSIRVPAMFCGVYGHKPSHNLIPMGGHTPGGAQMAPSLLSVVGPLARSAADLALALDVTAGPDADSPANRLALAQPRHQRLGSFRVFVLDHHPAARADSSTLGALERVADKLNREGAMVARQSSLLPDLNVQWKTYQTMLHTIITRRDPTVTRPPISAHQWLDLLDTQLKIRREWADFFRHFDIVLCPVFGTPAFPHTDEPDWRKRPLDFDGQPGNFGSQLGWAGIATVANLPSTAIPLGLSKQGLPIGVQAIGPFMEDKTTIAFAGMVGHEIEPPAIAL
ncbi:MAG: amidase [Alphaproteobacteria bacterium]|jgi:amidase|nr:MAG: amidase [Alphaproteobacteria bacterium]